MYATHSAAAGTRATARDEESGAEAFCEGCRPAVVRFEAAGNVAAPL